jgi:uncharacterized protein (TIGR02147 family)
MPRKKAYQLPDIFSYLSYAEWLSAAFVALQAQDSAITHRSFSQACGYRSSGAMALVMGGRRRLSSDGAQRIADALRLTNAEREHLLLMIGFEQAEDFEVRASLLEKMSAARRFSERWSGTLHAYRFYSHWSLPVLRELVALPDFQEDPAWVQRRVHGKLSRKEIREALDLLEQDGYLERGEDGRLRQTRAIIATTSELQSDVLKQHQREMMTLAGEALDSQPRERRDMRVMTVAISHNQAAKIKARLTLLQKELLAIVEEDEPIEEVYQLNVQWFALTDSVGLSAPEEGEPGQGDASQGGTER